MRMNHLLAFITPMPSPDTNTRPERASGWRKAFIEWGLIAAVFGLLYATGLHTQVLGTMQRGLLLTGLFDAAPQTSEGGEFENPGPSFSPQDYGFSMMRNDGTRVSLDELRGDVLFVNVWASWCPPCVAEMPSIETLHNKINEQQRTAGNESADIRFILLSMDEERQKADAFMQGRDGGLSWYFPETQIPELLRGSVLPTTYVISADGQQVYRKEGLADYSSDAFRDWLLELATAPE
ncbi:MAG: TlpA family protein disulfide reductase [Cyclonatronaceae bacterium]